jgi:PPP family 3-phenylpropionic acid transporter
MQSHSSSRDLQLVRLYYFFWIGAAGFLSPFVTLFYQSRGLNGTEIGLLVTMGALTSMLAAPIWGRWGDASRQPRRLIMLALLSSACFALLRGLQSLFWSISLFVILDGLIGTGAGALSNVQALTVTHGEKSGFGSIRLWGSLGWALVTTLAGLIIERLGLYVPFVGYAAMLVVSVSLLFWVRGPAGPRPTQEAEAAAPLGETLRALLRSRTLVGMALAFTTAWITVMGSNQFETLYMNRLGAHPGVIGAAATVSALFEIPFMLLADRWIYRHGAGRIMRIAMLIQACSFLPVVLIPSIPSFFASGILGSIALSLNLPAYYNSIVSCAPQGKGRTAVSLFDITLRNGINLLAAPLAGVLFDRIGPYWLYVIGLGGCLVAWLILQGTGAPQPLESPE